MTKLDSQRNYYSRNRAKVIARVLANYYRRKTMKRCRACKEYKPYSEFNKESGAKNIYYRSKCKPCYAEDQHKYYINRINKPASALTIAQTVADENKPVVKRLPISLIGLTTGSEEWYAVCKTNICNGYPSKDFLTPESRIQFFDMLQSKVELLCPTVFNAYKNSWNQYVNYYVDGVPNIYKI